MSARIPSVLVYLGAAVELDCSGHTYTWKAEEAFIVASDQPGKTIYILAGGRRGRVFSGATVPAKAAELFKRFNYKKADKATYLPVKISKVIKNGKALHIIYHSDKFGDSANYIHEFENETEVFVDRKIDPDVIILKNSQLRVTKKGIEG